MFLYSVIIVGRDSNDEIPSMHKAVLRASILSYKFLFPVRQSFACLAGYEMLLEQLKYA